MRCADWLHHRRACGELTPAAYCQAAIAVVLCAYVARLPDRSMNRRRCPTATPMAQQQIDVACHQAITGRYGAHLDA
jgi:hypothetical protein